MNKNLKNDIIDLLMEIIPFNKVPRGIYKILYKWGIGEYREYSIIEKAAENIYEKLYTSSGIDKENPGSAKSAALDFLECIRNFKIDESLLVKCNLDDDVLFKLLLEKAEIMLRSSSQLRQKFLIESLRSFSREIMNCAMEFPRMTLEINKSILQRNAQQIVRVDQ